MRRSSRRSRPFRQSLALDLTPMVDVVFLLIIFFMVSTTFITLESGLPVDLPQAQSSQAQASDVPTVTITREEGVFLSGTQIAEEDVEEILRDAIDATGTGVVVLRADQTVPHGKVVRIMDSIKRAGATRIAIATGGG